MSGVTNELIKNLHKLVIIFLVQSMMFWFLLEEQVACSLIAGRLIHKDINPDLGCLGRSLFLLRECIKILELIKLIRTK